MATKAKLRSDNRFQTSVPVRMADGGVKRKTIYAKTKTELEAKKSHYRKEYDRGAVIDATKVTFTDCFDGWMLGLDRKRGHSTIQSTLYRVRKHLLPVLGAKEVQKLRACDLQAILDDLAKGGNYCLDTVKKVRQNAVEIMNYAKGSCIIINNPFLSTEIPKGLSDGIRTGIGHEIVELITDTWKSHRIGILAVTMFYSGLRRGEVLALDVKDINLEKRAIRVNKAVEFFGVTPSIKRPKTAAGKRIVPIPSILANALKEYMEMEEYRCIDGFVSDVLFPGSNEGIMTLSMFRCAWENYMNVLNENMGGYNGQSTTLRKQVLQKFTPHQLRHTYCTNIRRGGAPDWVTKPCMGHSTKKDVTHRYTHATFEDKQKAIDAVFAQGLKMQDDRIEEETLFDD